LSIINIQNNTVSQYELFPTNPIAGTQSLLAYQNFLVGKINSLIDAAGAQVVFGPAAGFDWMEDGRLHYDTGALEVWFTPASPKSINATLSSVSKIEVLSRFEGVRVTYEGLMTYVGLPLQGADFLFSTASKLTISGYSVPGVGGATATFEGSIRLAENPPQGALTKFTERIHVTASNTDQVLTVQGNQPYTEAGLLGAALVQNVTHTVLDAGANTLRSVTASALGFRSDQVTFAGLGEKILAGNDQIQISGTVGVLVDGQGGNDDMRGGNLPDLLRGGAGNDAVRGGEGADTLFGGDGTDTVQFTGSRAQYDLARAGAAITSQDSVPFRDGFDTASEFEILRFSDLNVDLTIGARSRLIPAASLKTLEELYVGFFNRIPEAQGLGYWIDRMAAGLTLADVANQFYDAGLQFGVFSATMTDPQFVATAYANVLARPAGGPTAPPQQDIAYWVDRLATGADTKGTMILTMIQNVHAVFENDATWGFVAALLNNKAAVSQYYAVEQGLSRNVQADNVTYGAQIAGLITPTSTFEAIQFIGVDPFSTL
jgi:hypothetical protein